MNDIAYQYTPIVEQFKERFGDTLDDGGSPTTRRLKLRRLAVTPSDWKIIEEAFEQWLELSTDEQPKFLQDFSAAHPDLAPRLQSLIEADQVSDEKLSAPIEASVLQLVEDSTDPWIGKAVGAWDIKERIAAGGMGAVFLAVRSDGQFEQQVAIKIMSAQLLASDAVARFKAERQILANLSHPYIAQMHDGGTTDDGLPYLVMEYVDGSPIDTFCVSNNLGIDARLKLFQKVCEAVDYAHRNLTVHRDLKPNNILVDAHGDPKLLDFGIAKLLDESQLNITVALTRQGARAMTPEYASPEQVRGEPISVATDVYALGVLLYRLVTGQSPYGADVTSALQYERAIIEHEPRRPSTVVTATAVTTRVTGEQAIPADATSVRQLRGRLAGDLDTVVLKALQKEPERRYSSARAFYEDVENYLTHRPIDARADSTGYRLAKFVRRNRIGVAVAMAFVVLAVTSTTQIVQQRNRAEQQAATAEQVSEFLISMLQSSNPYEQNDIITARELLDRGADQIDNQLAGQPLVGARLRVTMAKAYSSLGLENSAAALGEKALKELATVGANDTDRAHALATLAKVEYKRQDYALAERHVTAALEFYAQSSDDNAADVVAAQITLSQVLKETDQPDDMLAVAHEAVRLAQASFGDKHQHTIDALANLSALYNEKGDYEQAKVLAQRVIQWLEQTHGTDNLLLAMPLHNLARIHWHQGQFRTANTLYARELKILETSLGSTHPAIHSVLDSMASNERKLGSEERAKAYYERAIKVLEQSESPALGKLAATYGSLGTLLMDTGHLDEAEPLIRRGLELAEEVYGVGNAATAYRLLHLGVLYRKRGQHEQARDYLNQAVQATLQRYSESHRDVQIMRLHVGVNETEAQQHALAHEILGGVLDSFSTNLGSDHPLVGQALLELSEVDIATSDFDLADQRLVQALEIYHKHRDPWHPDIELAWQRRAQIQAAVGNETRAAEFTAKAQKVRDERTASEVGPSE